MISPMYDRNFKSQVFLASSLLGKEEIALLRNEIKTGVLDEANTVVMVDCSQVEQLPTDAVSDLLALPDFFEENQMEIVFIRLSEILLQRFKQERLHLSLWVAQDEAEALSILETPSTLV